MEAILAGVGIGATRLSTVVASTDGKVLARAGAETQRDEGVEAVMKRVAATVNEACAGVGLKPTDLAAVGVGAPGPIRADGTLVSAPRLGWVDVPIASTLARTLEVPVAVENDCNVATLGEYELGAGRDVDSLVGIFVDFGLGGGIVANGGLVRGRNHLGAEVGHMIVQVGGRECSCGHRGCLEAYASKTGVGNRLVEEIEGRGRASALKEKGIDLADVRADVLASAYRAGDQVVRDVVLEMARYLGLGVANLVTLLRPDVVVIVGDLFDALGAELMAPVRDSAKETTFPPSGFDDVRIVLSELGDDAVPLGAATYAMRVHLG